VGYAIFHIRRATAQLCDTVWQDFKGAVVLLYMFIVLDSLSDPATLPVLI
jgi:hypothetical protein